MKFTGMKCRRLVKIILWPMSFIGVNSMQSDSLQNYIRIASCCLVHVYGMYGTFSFSYHSNDDFYNCVIPIAYGTCLIMVFFAVLFLQKYKCKVRQLLCSINDHVFTYPDEERLKMEYSGWLSEDAYGKMQFWILFYEIFGFMLATVSPFVGYFFIGELRTFIYPAYTPWKVDSAFVYILTYFFQSCVASSVFWVYYVLQIYFMFVLTEFLRQFRKLNRAVRTLNERTCCDVFTPVTGGNVADERRAQLKRVHFIRQEMNRSLETRYNQVYREKLIVCIKHHQKLFE